MTKKYPIKDNEIIRTGTDNKGRKYYTVAVEWQPGHFRMEKVYVDDGDEVKHVD